MNEKGLAQNPDMRQRFLNWLRGTNVGQAVQVSPQQQRGVAAMQQAGVDINRTPAQVVMPQPQAPKGYSIDEIMRQVQNDAPRYDAAGNRIR
jgi:hypothetical protein